MRSANVSIFSGTNTNLQLFTEVLSGITKRPNFLLEGTVNSYFLEAFYSLWLAGINKEFDKLAAQFPQHAIYVTGHSLGAVSLKARARAAFYFQYPNDFRI